MTTIETLRAFLGGLLTSAITSYVYLNRHHNPEAALGGFLGGIIGVTIFCFICTL